MPLRWILIVGLIALLGVAPAFADPLSDIGLFVADRETTTVGWKAGVYGTHPTISGVIAGSVAEQAGLKSGDVILSVGDKKVASTDELRGMAQMLLPMVVLRGMERVTTGEGRMVAATQTIAAPKTNTEPPENPILRIETGMHTAAINQIAVDASGRWLVTASDDTTLRVWDLKNLGVELAPSVVGRAQQAAPLQPFRTIRPPIGNGFEGMLYSVAISPEECGAI